MATSRRADARNTTLIGLATTVPAVVVAVLTGINGATLFTVAALPLIAVGALITWLGTFDWVVSRGAEVVKATNG